MFYNTCCYRKTYCLSVFNFFFRALLRYTKLLWSMNCHGRKNRSVADVFRQYVNRHPNKICFVLEDQEWTFQQVKYVFKKRIFLFFQQITIFT